MSAFKARKASLYSAGVLILSALSAAADDVNPPPPPPLLGFSLANGTQASIYGFLMTNVIYNDHRANFIDVPTLATSQSATTGPNESSFNMTARQSRLGFKLNSPGWNDAVKLMGILEMDFWGLRATSGAANDVVQTAPRLRLAFARAEGGPWAGEAGQDWMIMAPLNPTSLARQAVPALSAAGNLWNRLPQVRGEYRASLWGAKLGIFRPFSADETGRVVSGVNQANQTDQPGSGELGRAPMLQYLFELTPKIAGRSSTFGVSGSYMSQSFTSPVLGGNAGTTADNNVDSYLWVVHASVPLSERVKVQAEGFYGRNTLPFQGIGGVTSPDGTSLSGKITRGGWVEAGVKVAKKVSTNAGIGAEKLDGNGLATGSVFSNATAFGNVIVEVTSALFTSLEYTHIHTAFRNQLDGEAGQFNWAIQYKF